MKTFTSFNESNLFSKKEWLLQDSVVLYTQFLTPFILAIIVYDLFICSRKLKIYLLLIIGFTSLFTSDLLTAYYHCFFIDNSFSYKKFNVENNHIVINTHYGYASCHHIFPSNWKDVKDTTILNTSLVLACIPVVFIFIFISNCIVKIWLYLIIIFIILSVFSHKYSHEKLHNRKVPGWIEVLLNCNLLLSPKKHQMHHIENNYNWALLNGMSDWIFNEIIRMITYFYGILPIEEQVYNANMCEDEIINIKFVGDIEGTLQCKLHNNLLVMCDQEQSVA